MGARLDHAGLASIAAHALVRSYKRFTGQAPAWLLVFLRPGVSRARGEMLGVRVACD